ncbi:hypothetical protein MT325_m523L [Paramecium bursaria chlorella virus MT325]|uniref:Uncharacterized protein m523L n=1 Tax=Paramecium bursaria Chlorella virus MT325 TaxID=346932 RepID=A7IUQ3_PBCVM|nr:hypothetical protein MT325_m523L [Paramecium bursaria chlorella virus MT325]
MVLWTLPTPIVFSHVKQGRLNPHAKHILIALDLLHMYVSIPMAFLFHFMQVIDQVLNISFAEKATLCVMFTPTDMMPPSPQFSR